MPSELRISPVKITARECLPLFTWRIEDHRGGLVFSLRTQNNHDRALAAYRGSTLGPRDFPELFEREPIGDWWRVRRGGRLP